MVYRITYLLIQSRGDARCALNLENASPSCGHHQTPGRSVHSRQWRRRYRDELESIQPPELSAPRLPEAELYCSDRLHASGPAGHAETSQGPATSSTQREYGRLFLPLRDLAMLDSRAKRWLQTGLPLPSLVFVLESIFIFGYALSSFLVYLLLFILALSLNGRNVVRDSTRFAAGRLVPVYEK